MFDSVGEVYTWLAKRGWRPNWHTEPQDSVDFTIKCVQTFLRRLISNEASIGDQVEDRKKQLELAAKFDDIGETTDVEEEIMREIEYEGEDEFDDEDALN